MKKKFIKLVLVLAQIVIDFGIIASVFIAFGALVIGACTLVSPRLLLGRPLTWAVGIQVFLIVVIAIIAFIGALAVHQLLDNLNNGKYFVRSNCQALKNILWTAVTATILQGLAAGCNDPALNRFLLLLLWIAMIGRTPLLLSSFS